MPNSSPDVRQLIAQLSDPKSSARRSAAKKLRKLRDPTAGPALLDALKTEMTGRRPWETRYQMIMALGYCGCKEALPFLNELAERDFEATILTMALGHTIVRLQMKSLDDEQPIRGILQAKKPELLQGALQAMGAIGMTVGEKLAGTILDATSELGQGMGEDHWKLYLCAAASSWPGTRVRRFLQGCQKHSDSNIREAATMALEGKRWQYEKNLL